MTSARPFHPNNYPPFRSAVVQVVLLLAAVAAVFLAGTERQGTTGIFLAAGGALMVFLAPNRALPWRYFAVCGAMVALSALALLPKGFWPMPEWRVWLPGNSAIPELWTISVAPRETVYWMAVLFAAFAVGLFSLAHPISATARVFLGLLGAVCCAVYAGTALYAKATGWEYPFFDRAGWSPPEFGFFPNRNHTAAFLVTGSLLSLGLIRDGWSNKRPVVFLLAIGTMAVCVYSLLFHSISRGGVVFLVAGIFLWLALLGKKHVSVPLIVSAAVVGGFILFLFLGTEGQARDRLLGMFGVRPPDAERIEGVTANLAGESPQRLPDLRWRIFKDTLGVLGDYPLTGTGIGTYPYIYPFYAKASLTDAVAVHPESDWLMMAAECGIPFVILAAGLLVMLVRGILPLRRSENWPLRWGFACAALVVILHGLVDVPLHRVELGWWVLVLAGVAFGCPLQGRSGRDTSSPVQRLVFGICGLGILAFGALLIRAEWLGGTPFPPFRGAAAVVEMRQLAKAGDPAGASKFGRSEIAFSPMSRGLYRELGFREIRDGGSYSGADNFFLAERALHPTSSQVPLDQGRLWMGFDESRARRLWVEALNKHLALAANGVYPDMVTFYERMLGEARARPEIYQALGRESRISPDLQLVWIIRSPAGGLDQVAGDSAFLGSLDERGRRAFLKAWHTPATRQKVDRFLELHPDWEQAAWPVRVRQMEVDGKFEELVETLRQRSGVDLSLPELSPEQIDSSQPPYELAEQVAWFLARKNAVSARRVVAEAAAAGQLEGLRVQCALAVQSGDWQAAWQALDKYLRETKRADYL